MCQCIWYLFFGPLHLKIPAPKNQQWRISFGDSDVFSFGIFGLNVGDDNKIRKSKYGNNERELWIITILWGGMSSELYDRLGEIDC